MFLSFFPGLKNYCCTPAPSDRIMRMRSSLGLSCMIVGLFILRRKKMGTGRESPEEGFSLFKFWILFVVGLVVVLSLFRGFMGGVENAKLREAERGVKRKSRRGQGRKEEHQPSSSSEHEHKD